MRKQHLLFFLLTLICSHAKPQCPQVYDGTGTLSSNPYFISCTGAAYTASFQSNVSWGTYTINWGDGSPITNNASYTANSIINHFYASATDTFPVTLIIPSLNCTLTGVTVMETAAVASLAPVAHSVCAGKTITLTNQSLNNSKATRYTWDFGDATILNYDYTNAGTNVNHTYLPYTVNCETVLKLTAQNYCNTTPSTFSINPMRVFELDIVDISPNKYISCSPDNQFTFTNSTVRNCASQGNTAQRREQWNFGDYWGYGHDSIIGWRNAPAAPVTITYPAPGTYTVQLRDSSQCGSDALTIPVNVIHPPTANVAVPASGYCVGMPLTFTNTSDPGLLYTIHFGDGGGFTPIGSGAKPNKTYATAGTYTLRLVTYIPGANAFCRDTVKVPITIGIFPTVDFSVNLNTACGTATDVVFTDMSTNAVFWNWDFGNGNTSTLQIPPMQNYTSAAVYVPTLVAMGTTSCSNTQTLSITVYPNPMPDFSLVSYCENAVADFTNTTTSIDPVTSYTWDFGDGSATTSFVNPSHTFTSATTYSVKLTATTAFCSDVVEKVVSVGVVPSMDFTFTPTLTCPPIIVTFSNNSANATSYLWSFEASPSATSSATDPTYFYDNTTLNPMTHSVSLIAYGTLGCNDTLEQTITINPRPVASFTVNEAEGICPPMATTFTNNTVGATTYSWNFGDGNGSSTVNPVHSYSNTTLAPVEHTVVLIAENSFSCTDTIQHIIHVFPQSLVSLSVSPDYSCTPLAVDLPTLAGVSSYTWDYGDGTPTFSTLAAVSHTYINSTTANQIFTIHLTADNSYGCVNSAVTTLTVLSKPILNFSVSADASCSPLNVTFTNTSANAVSYLWNFGDGSTHTATNTSHTFSNTSNTAGEHFTTTLIATTNDGCQDSLSKIFLVYHQPSASFSVNAPDCASAFVSFTNTSLGASTYSWSFGDASAATTASNPSYIYNTTIPGNATYTVKLLATSVSGCTNMATSPITVFAQPVANFAVTSTVGCSPFSTTFTNSSTNNHSLVWRFGDGTTGNVTDPAHTFVNPSNIADHTFTCTLIAGHSNGCKDSVSRTVLVYYKPKADFTTDTLACSNRTLTLNSTSISGDTLIYQWTFGDGKPAFSADPSIMHAYTNTSTVVQSFTASLAVIAKHNCRDTARVRIKVSPKPHYNIIASADSGCAPLNVTFAKIDKVTEYQWFNGKDLFGGEGNIVRTFFSDNAKAKTYTITLIAQDASKCADTSVKYIKAFPLPTALFETNPADSVYVNKPLTTKNLSADARLYEWHFGDTDMSSGVEPEHTYRTVGFYSISLIAITNKGCRDTAVLDIKVLHETLIEMPNAFTPNPSGSRGTLYDPSDLSNDIFHPYLKGINRTKFHFSIYSRWGELLFDTQNPDEGWDGYYRGKLCEQDVYIWKLDAVLLDGKTFNKTGDVLLLK
ncbi:MAG: PKD domain-containing protein [Bacteroidetes bacterium]|nr:PKD domain-containing protein [Bacteroidota bacterium]